VEIYRQGQDVEVIESPATLLGEEVLPGFILDLQGMMGAIAPASATLSSCSIAQKAIALFHSQVIHSAIVAHHL